MAFQQVTRSDIRTDVLRQLGNSTFWRSDEIDRLINESIHVWNLATGYWKDTQTVATTANTHWYSTPSNILAITRVEYNGRLMQPGSLYDLDFSTPSWEADSNGDGGSVPTQPEIWAPAGLTLFVIWPADAVANNTLQVNGIKHSPTLTADGDFIDVGREELKSLIDYICHVAVLKEGGQEFKDSAAWLQEFFKSAAERNGMLNASAKFREWMGVNKDEQRNPHTIDSHIGAR